MADWLVVVMSDCNGLPVDPEMLELDRPPENSKEICSAAVDDAAMSTRDLSTYVVRARSWLTALHDLATAEDSCEMRDLNSSTVGFEDMGRDTVRKAAWPSN